MIPCSINQRLMLRRHVMLRFERHLCLRVALFVKAASVPGKCAALGVAMLILEGHMFVLIDSDDLILGVPVLILNMFLCTAKMVPEKRYFIYEKIDTTPHLVFLRIDNVEQKFVGG